LLQKNGQNGQEQYLMSRVSRTLTESGNLPSGGGWQNTLFPFKKLLPARALAPASIRALALIMCLRKNAMVVTLSLIVFLDRQDCLGSYMHHS